MYPTPVRVPRRMEEPSSVSKSFPTCPICLEVFTDPRLLSCLHILCYECLRDIIARGKENGKFECPWCRNPEQIPSNGADGFPRKTFADPHEHSGQKSERETPNRARLEIQKAKQNQLLCSNLKGDNDDCGHAERFCLDCCEFYCGSCSKAHRRFTVSSTHEQVAVAEITVEMVREARAKFEIPVCPDHKDEKLKLYCNPCGRAVCSTCCHTLHQSHTVQEMAKVDVQEFKVELELNLTTLTTMKEEVQHQFKMENDSQAKLEANVSSAKKTVGNTVKKVCQKLDQKSGQISLKLDKKVEKSETKVAARNKELTNYKERVESLETSVRNLLNKGTMYDRLDNLKGMRKRLQGLQASPLPPGPVTGEIPSSSELVGENMDGLVFQEEFKLSESGATGRGALKVKVTCCFEWEKEQSGDVPQKASGTPRQLLDQSGPALAESGPSPTESGPSPAESGHSLAESGPSPAKSGPSPAESDPPAKSGPSPTESGPSPADQLTDEEERTVIVEGFDPNTTPDILDTLLQKCLAVDPVERLCIRDNRAEVVLSSKDNVNKLLETPPRVCTTSTPLKVSRLPLTKSKTVTVEGCGRLKEKIVRLFFSNKRKSGGGPIEDFQMDSPDGVARIIFCNQTDAEEVVGRGPQKLGGCTLNAKPF